MRIKIHKSSSAGNLTTIERGEDKLILDCGLPIKKIKEILDFDLQSYCGCLVTHEHGDHAKGVSGLLKSAINVYMSGGTKRALKLRDHHRLNIIEPHTTFNLNQFLITPIPVVHDASEPFAYYIKKDDKYILFATDCCDLPFAFHALTHLIIECNYDDDLLIDNFANSQGQKHARINENHLGLQDLLAFIKRNNNVKLEEIHLLHCSDTNGDKDKFKSEIEKLTGAYLYV